MIPGGHCGGDPPVHGGQRARRRGEAQSEFRVRQRVHGVRQQHGGMRPTEVAHEIQCQGGGKQTFYE